jgi:BASS family bile acid:Na+ symporter
MAPLTVAGALAAYWHPPLFLIFRDVYLWLFAATMFALGVVLVPDELRELRIHPQRVALGVLTQFTVMPMLGFAAAVSGLFSPAVALGFVLVGCAPGAMASNVVVYLAGGATAYSIAMTTVASLLAPWVTPALVAWLGGAILPVEFWPLMRTILYTLLLPLLAGMALRTRLGPRQLAAAGDIAPAIASLAILIICSYAVAANQTRIGEVGASVFACVIVVNALGYLAGWWLGRLYRFDKHYRFTLAVEIGMQNAGLGVALALAHFPPEAALPGALFAVWCILTAAGFSAWLRVSKVRL